MKRSVILFAALVFLISFGISGANDLVHLHQFYIGEDNPKNQKWLKMDKSGLREWEKEDAIECNVLCYPNKKPLDPTIPESSFCMVRYLNRDDRKPYELKYDRIGKKFYLLGKETPYDSKRATDQAVAEKKYATLKTLDDTRQAYGSWPAIWVMSQDERLYVSSTPQPGMFNHSSLLAGESVICAGEIIIIDGKITFINNRSGHYMPPDKALNNAIDKLRKAGVKLDPVLVLEYMGAKYKQSLKEHDDGVTNVYSAPPSLRR